MNLNGAFIYMCPNHYKVLGFNLEELHGESYLNVIHPDDIKIMKIRLKEIMKTRKPVLINYRIKRGKGCWIRIHSICTPYILNGKVKTFIFFSNPNFRYK